MELTKQQKRIIAMAEKGTDSDALIVDILNDIEDKIEEIKNDNSVKDKIDSIEFPEIPEIKEVVFPEVQKISGSVSVDNLRDIKFPTKIEVTNFPKPEIIVEAPSVQIPPFPEFPKEMKVEVTNQQEVDLSPLTDIIKDGRLKVAVDKVGGSGSGGAILSVTSNTDDPISNSGLVIMGKHKSADVHTVDEEGDADYLSLDDFDAVRVADQRSLDLDTCNATTGWSALNNDTINIAVSTNHVFGTGALSFDKTNGTANTIYGCIQKTITTLNVSEIFEAGGFIGMSLYLSSLSNVVGAFIRVGTDSSNYNSWFWSVDSLTADAWLNLRTPAAFPSHSRNTGNGWNPTSISYIAVGVEFSSETNTLSGILVDHLHLVKGRVTSSDITNSITTSITTPNINIHRVGGTPVATNNGTASSSTQRVTIASDSTGQVKITPLGAPTTTSVTLTNADTDYKLPTSELANRRTIIVSNNTAYDFYLGQTGVIDCDATPPVGILLPPNGSITLDCSTGLYAQCDTAGQKLTVTEL